MNEPTAVPWFMPMSIQRGYGAAGSAGCSNRKCTVRWMDRRGIFALNTGSVSSM